METSKLYEIAVFGLKCIVLAASVYLIMSTWQYLDKKFLETLPKLPKIVLYILIVVFGAMWVLGKLLAFGIIEV